MKHIAHEIDVRTNPIRATYFTDCFRRIAVKQEDGSTKMTVKRWVQEHQVQATVALIAAIPAVFHKGARIA